LVLDFDASTDPNTSEVFELPDLIEELERELHCKLPVTWGVDTPRGGRHLYFQMPPVEPIGNRTALLGPSSHIDVRGEGGYALLPPSVREDGIAYRWGASQPVLKDELPAKAPQALIDCILRLGKWAPEPRFRSLGADRTDRRPSLRLAARDGMAVSSEYAAGDIAVERYAAAALQNEIRDIEQAGRGGRNNRLYVGALRLGELVGAGALDEDRVRAKLEAAAEANGLIKEDGIRAVRKKSFPEFCGNSREVEVSDDAMRQCAALTNSVRRVTCYDLLTQLRVTEPSETTGQRGGMGLTTTIDGIIDHRWGERDPKIDTTAGYNQR
jgi:putative DNA primase/helicase